MDETKKAATIHTHGQQWKRAEIVGVGQEADGAREVLIVWHAAFPGEMDFYAEADAEGRHYNVGNRAFWLTIP